MTQIDADLHTDTLDSAPLALLCDRLHAAVSSTQTLQEPLARGALEQLVRLERRRTSGPLAQYKKPRSSACLAQKSNFSGVTYDETFMCRFVGRMY